ncbi:hypothetical protein F5I97DRAFT_964467 [Phlebopus sp. FC_14]|nr:hypothetical protein F5I97DRAFT_964467 [Phlebopus sp. FC_14]
MQTALLLLCLPFDLKMRTLPLVSFVFSLLFSLFTNVHADSRDSGETTPDYKWKERILYASDTPGHPFRSFNSSQRSLNPEDIVDKHLDDYQMSLGAWKDTVKGIINAAQAENMGISPEFLEQVFESFPSDTARLKESLETIFGSTLSPGSGFINSEEIRILLRRFITVLDNIHKEVLAKLIDAWPVPGHEARAFVVRETPKHI